MPSDPKNVRSTKLHRVNAAARMLDVSRPTIYRLVRAGELTLVKIGKRASAITEDSLREFIAAHSRLEEDGS
jgi:excisionase family DNA binding protein